MSFDSSECKWSDLKVYLNGQRITKVTGLMYDTERDAEHIYAEGDDAVDVQVGNRKHTGTLKVYKSAVDAMNAAAKAAGFDDLTDVPWVIVADYKQTTVSPRTTDTLPNVRFTKYSKGMEQNAKAMPIELPFLCLKPVQV